ncbi:ATP-grasp domain-containing protein [Roseomonas elaeocarpi]|uniref:RimK family alpha-L-glutamate ligase n=1 Tax=Roseomonas elaeocarpi TaxID=907779 RepID=A0ABV6JUV4_9PROT
MSRIHVIHENPAWLPPLAEAFDRRGLPWTEWDLSGGVFDLAAPPPEGVFYNRMSASSHTRGHRYAAELTAAVLAWLTQHGRRVVNGPRALDLEISKARQYAALEAAGVAVPRTVLALGDTDRVVSAAREHFAGGPVILKPNRGGKGLGVRLFSGAEALEAHLRALPEDEHPADGLWLLQEHIRAERPVITRAEFVGGRFLYAVEVDTSAGFELCPADVCAVDDAFCPVGETPAANASLAPAAPRFRVLEEGIDAGLRSRLEAFLAANGTEVAGVEFIRGTDGRLLTYDLNTNTNYNAEAEEKAGILGTDRSGPGAIARFLGEELGRTVSAAA